jgi:Big-like domain-containing protein
MILAVSLLGLAAVPGSLPAAQAAAGSPPVTTPDSATVYQGNGVTVQPVNNDHDADNELLTICRLGTEHYKGMSADFFQNDWEVFVDPNVKPGTYTFTYYACDFSTLVPGTITITVKKLPEVKVTKIASRPGHLRVTNPADFKVRFLYGSFKEDRPDGRLLIDKGASVVIPVFRTRIDWIATDRKGELFLGTGHVDNIKPGHAAGRHTGHVSLSPRLAETWRAAS